ncbi:MAG: MFS transporter [Filomicrobium sp.]
MFQPLRNRTYRHLFFAQVIALLGTGLLTVALGLLAHDLAGDNAGLVLGTALAIKMIAYIGIAPVVGGFANLLPRRAFLIGLEVVRGGIALLLPFVDQIWQIYILIFLLQSASAAFTPTFQATIPDILPDEKEYTAALSLSRLAYDLESLLSPALAAALLTVMSFHWLFAGTSVGFLVAALFVMSVAIPVGAVTAKQGGIWDRVSRGIRNYLATPRLRGLLLLNFAAAAGGAMVIVNTVVYVRSVLDGREADVAIALAAFGAGSMIIALLMPTLLTRLADRTVMLIGAAGIALVLLTFAAQSVYGPAAWAFFLTTWFVLGGCYSAILTPSGRLLKRSSVEDTRPALFAAQFALSHVCWLVTYPLAGWLGASATWAMAFGVLGCVAGVAVVAAAVAWPRNDPETIAHVHTNLRSDDPHLIGAEETSTGFRHSHRYVIDERHRQWPRKD